MAILDCRSLPIAGEAHCWKGDEDMGSTLALSVKACPGFPPVAWLRAELQQAASLVLLLGRMSSAPTAAPGAGLGTSRSLQLLSPVDTSGTVLITPVCRKKG